MIAMIVEISYFWLYFIFMETYFSYWPVKSEKVIHELIPFTGLCIYLFGGGGQGRKCNSLHEHFVF